MLYVIGGTLEQASHYIMRKGISTAHAINDPLELRGLAATDEVVLVGTFLLRPDWQAFNGVFDAVAACVRFDAA